LRKYNCVSYSSCLDKAAADDLESLPCAGCTLYVISEQGAGDTAVLWECALGCCRLLLAAFMEPEEPLMIHGFRIIFQDGHWIGVQNRPGQKRRMIRVGSLEQAEEKITRYISMKR